VTHVVYSLDVGGLENGLVNIVNDEAADFTHAIICVTRAGPLRARLRRDIEVFELGKQPGHDLKAFVRLIRLVRGLDPDVVHSRNWAALDAVVAARLAGVARVVHGEHGYEGDDPEGRSRFKNRIRRMCGHLVDRFVVVSDDLNAWLTDRVGIAPKKIVKIANGVDTKRFAPGDDMSVRHELGVASDAHVIGTVGRLAAVKDQASLVRAFARLAAEHPETILLIVGDGRCRSSLQALAAQSGVAPRVRFLGERGDVPRLLRAMDVFVLPSRAEGMSNTLLEAMASGLPIVATRVGGNSEIVADGVTGFLVERDRPEALAGAIREYLKKPKMRQEPGSLSRERAVRMFALEGMRAAYADVYRQLARPRSTARA